MVCYKLTAPLIAGLIMLMSVVAYAGSQTHNPDADVTIGTDWTHHYPGAGNAYLAVSDALDDSLCNHYDNNNLTYLTFTLEDNTAGVDTTIDSVTYFVKWRTDNTGNTFGIYDSLDGGESGRITEAISTLTANVWRTDSMKYALQPNGADAWTWTDIDNLILGVKVIAKSNNKNLDITKIWATVWWTTPSASGVYRGQVISIGGN